MSDVAAELLQRLIRCDTTNPPGKGSHCSSVLADWLQDRGSHPKLRRSLLSEPT